MEGSHRVPRVDRAHPQWHGHQGSDSTCLPALQVGAQKTWRRPLFKSTTRLPPLRRFLIGSMVLHASASLMLRMASEESTLMKSLLTWPPSTHIMVGNSCCACLLVWRCPRASFRCDGPSNGPSTQHYCHSWWYMDLGPHSWGTWLAPLEAYADSSPAWCCLQQL